MNTAQIKYSGNLRTQAVHLKSENKLITDAPTDNHGKGETFSPTDLLSVSLVSCMLTVMGIASSKRGISFSKVHANMKKVMTDNPRRVKTISVEMIISENWTEDEKRIMEKIALNCPVAKSLSPEIEQKVSFIYD